MRLIDADSLLDKLIKTQRYFEVKFDIEEAPTVDAVPVRHGHWKCYSDCGCTQCSVCNWSVEEYIEHPYCPNCVAKMDEPRNDKQN